MFYRTFILFILFVSTNYASQCSFEGSKRPPKYHIVEKCYRSQLGVISKANYSSLISCQRLGIEKKGLAINFSPFEAWSGENMTMDYTCEVLKCAEADGGLSMVNDTRYDYYSIYAKPIPHVNSTCVPAIGMFYLATKKQNYTLGFRECRNISSVPADVTSEQKTDALAQLLAGASVDAAFVGMRSKNGSAFMGTKGDTLDCTIYRAWAPGHPRRHRDKFDCVLLTRQRMWRSTPCQNNFPMLCELVPGGPYKRGSIFASRNKTMNDTMEQSNKDDE